MATSSSIAFLQRVGARRPWVVGGMAHGIGGVELVTEAARAGCLAFYGAAGLEVARVVADLDRLDPALPVGLNLAHHSPTHDAALLDAARRRGLRAVEVSGALRPTAELVAHRFAQTPAPRFVLAKVSRTRAVHAWMAPPTARVLRDAVQRGLITEPDAERAAHTPCADALVLEGDSGGHTDRRAWLPMLADAQAQRRDRPVWIGVAGGFGTPSAVRAALAAGADFVLGGSVHQTCVESAVRPDVRTWLEDAGTEDFAYAPSAVWFGTPARVQVLARPTPFAAHADRLERIWRERGDQPLSGADRTFVEDLLGCPIHEAWMGVRDWASMHDPSLLAATTTDRARLALVCRGWLASCSRRALVDDGRPDVQVWSGPAAAALNHRSAGTALRRDRPVGALVRWLCPQELL